MAYPVAPEYELDVRKVIPVSPNPPRGFSIIDFEPLGEAARKIQSANDDRATAEEPARGWIGEIRLSERRSPLEGWWGEMGRPFAWAHGTYIRNSMGETKAAIGRPRSGDR